MYRFPRVYFDVISEAHRLAAAGLAELKNHRSDIHEDFALQFLGAEILFFYQQGETDPGKLAGQALGLLRDHLKKQELILGGGEVT